MHYSRTIEILNHDTETVKISLTTFFLMNNFNIKCDSDNQMRVENLYPRFDLKRPPAAEIKQAVFKWRNGDNCIIVEAEGELYNPAKMLKKRKVVIYTIIGTLILGDMIYTASGFFWADFEKWLNINNLAMLLFVPIFYFILHNHFFSMYKSKHHNDLDRVLENLEFGNFLK